jgi:hypothetical protein
VAQYAHDRLQRHAQVFAKAPTERVAQVVDAQAAIVGLTDRGASWPSASLAEKVPGAWKVRGRRGVRFHLLVRRRDFPSPVEREGGFTFPSP